jgi:putative ABC transport system substrate-binding protein
MKRREFIAVVGGAAVWWPLGAHGQQPGKVYRIGFLSYLGCGASLDRPGAFRQAMREVGYVEGANLVLECRDALGRIDRFPALAAELVRLKGRRLSRRKYPGDRGGYAGDEDHPDRDGSSG